MRSRGKPTGENLSSFVDVKTNWKIDRGIKVKINNKLNPGEFEASAYSVLIFAKIGQFLFIFSFLQYSLRRIPYVIFDLYIFIYDLKISRQN